MYRKGLDFRDGLRLLFVISTCCELVFLGLEALEKHGVLSADVCAGNTRGGMTLPRGGKICLPGAFFLVQAINKGKELCHYYVEFWRYFRVQIQS